MAERWKRFENQLNNFPGLKRTHAEDQTLARWTNENVRSLVRSTSDSLSGELRTIQLRPLDGVQIELSQISDPKTSNQSSLITSVNFKGNRHYLTSDADGKVVRRLVSEGNYGQSGVMKWPHHISVPKNLDSPDALALKELIRVRKPHTIILSNKASNQPEAKLELIEDLVEDVMGEDKTRIIYTGRDGDIHIIVINSTRQTEDYVADALLLAALFELR